MSKSSEVFYSKSRTLPPLHISLITAVISIPFLYRFFTSNLSSSLAYSSLTSTWPPHKSGLHDLYGVGHLSDVKDAQWYAFRKNLPILAALFVTQIMLRRMFIEYKVHVACVVGLGFAGYLHRVDVVPVLGVVALVYGLTTYGRSGKAVWMVVGLALLGAKVYERRVDWTAGVLIVPNWFARSQSVFNWSQSFNLLCLRLISFSEDVRQKRPGCDTHASVVMFLAYVFYAPLYITGPIETFEDFVADHFDSVKKSKKAPILPYLTRFLLVFTAFELYASFVYAGAATQVARTIDPSVLEKITTVENMGFVSLGALFGAFFKFTVIWRFARLCSLLDGVDPPENMMRCIANTSSVSTFWKGFHCSFNQWLVRYLYIPLGGSKNGLGRKIFAASSCFVFVAAWHDLELRFLVWGFAFSFVVALETLAMNYADRVDKRSDLNCSQLMLWNVIKSAIGGLSILCLLLVNMIGFTLGPDGTKSYLQRTTWQVALEWWFWASMASARASRGG